MKPRVRVNLDRNPVGKRAEAEAEENDEQTETKTKTRTAHPSRLIEVSQESGSWGAPPGPIPRFSANGGLLWAPASSRGA